MGILLVIARSGQTPLVLVGEQRGVSSSQRSGVIDRRRMQLSGELREALDDTPVAVHLEATCRWPTVWARLPVSRCRRSTRSRGPVRPGATSSTAPIATSSSSSRPLG